MIYQQYKLINASIIKAININIPINIYKPFNFVIKMLKEVAKIFYKVVIIGNKFKIN